MLFSEEKFRKICRSEQGGLESMKFQDAIESTNADPVMITFDIGLNEKKIVSIPRAVALIYAKLALEEIIPESELIKYLNPDVSSWVKLNRKKMCEKIREAKYRFNPDHHVALTIIWPIHPPDSIPFSVGMAYLNKYENF
mgnify:FL=1